jgi:hypothetical protein
MKKTYIIVVKYQMTVEAEDIQKAIAIACDVELPFYKIDSFSIEESFEDMLAEKSS